MAKSRMVNQMSEQMDIPKSEAKSLMNKAKQMNDVEMADGGLNEGQEALRKERPDIVAKMEGVSEEEVMKMAEGGTATMPEDLGYMVGGVMKEKKRGPIKYAAGGAIKGKNFSGIF